MTQIQSAEADEDYGNRHQMHNTFDAGSLIPTDHFERAPFISNLPEGWNWHEVCLYRDRGSTQFNGS